MTLPLNIQTVALIMYPSGEISIRLDGSEPLGDDCLMLPITARDDGGIYLSRDDADVLAAFIAGRELAPVPGAEP